MSFKTPEESSKKKKKKKKVKVCEVVGSLVGAGPLMVMQCRFA